MNRDGSGPRPWLAVVLALLVTGGGHAYLRRWGRALGWVVVAVAVTVAWVPEEALRAFVDRRTVTAALVPTFAVVFASVGDAYLLARGMRGRAAAVGAAGAAGETADTPEADGRCPDCGREIDPELDFCPWCSARLPGAERDGG